ncbi:hypothetical protein [Actinoplanes philippinensis]
MTAASGRTSTGDQALLSIRRRSSRPMPSISVGVGAGGFLR